jgi:arylsulfate sulfotransferase
VKPDAFDDRRSWPDFKSRPDLRPLAIAHRFSGGIAVFSDESPGDGRTTPSATVVPSPGDLPATGDDPTAKAVGFLQRRRRSRFSLVLNWLGRACLLALASLACVPPVARGYLLVPNTGTQNVTITAQTPGPKPFISFVSAHMADANLLAYVEFAIAPKPGSATRPVDARYSSAYLLRRGYLNLRTGTITVPVFGLYAGYTNDVRLVCGFVDGTSEAGRLSIQTAKYKGGVFDRPIVVKALTQDTPLSYSFMLLKDYAFGDCPVVMDTDQQIRWVGTADMPTPSSIYFDNSFFIAYNVTGMARMEWDGTFVPVADYAAQGVAGFQHNFDFGKTGIITDIDTPDYLESVNMEVDTSGHILHTWNLADIITEAMLAGGDDPTLFVAAPGTQVDWFHNNSAAYRPSDDSIIISSRENFVIALDYETGTIKWILGDTTKQWYGFSSLRKYALRLGPNSHFPIGQHSVSFVSDRLLLFDDGFPSSNHAPAGKYRLYSAPRKYAIDQAAGLATEVWNYLAEPPIYSPITSSVYEDAPGNYLIDYATAGPFLFADLIGLNAPAAKVLDFKLTEVQTSGTAWNAVPLHLENLVFN